MSCKELNVAPGVVSGEKVHELLSYAKEHGFALPAVNVTTSSTLNAVLETAAELRSPVIVQLSNGGATFFAGSDPTRFGKS